MDELEIEFSLDKTLTENTWYLGDLPLSRVLLMNDATFPWFILVPRRAGIVEIYHLSLADRQQLMEESSLLSESLADLYMAKKMNVAALGNQIRQLHVHHIVRFEQDKAWPNPVWGFSDSIVYDRDAVRDIQQKISVLLGEGFIKREE